VVVSCGARWDRRRLPVGKQHIPGQRLMRGGAAMSPTAIAIGKGYRRCKAVPSRKWPR
jgi:hypothetical protein